MLKTNTSIERLQDGSCIKRITQTKNGNTETKEEKMDCDQAMQEVREKDDNNFSQSNDSFDERMREKVNEMKKSFSKEEDKGNLKTTEETYSDGTNKVVKVTRESDSIEETKKTEKIPDGSKRILKISREHFFEETKKSVGPMENEEEPEAVKLLDENFAEESKDKTLEEKKDTGDDIKGDKKKEEEEVEDSEEIEDMNDEDKVNDPGEENDGDQRLELGVSLEEEDGFFKRLLKSIFKIMFWPLFKLKIL